MELDTLAHIPMAQEIFPSKRYSTAYEVYGTTFTFFSTMLLINCYRMRKTVPNEREDHPPVHLALSYLCMYN